MMKKKSVIVFAVIALLLALLFLFRNGTKDVVETEYSFLALPDSPLNATYRIDGKEITLTEGSYDEEGKIEQILEPVYGDINGDNLQDAVFVVRYSKDDKTSYLLTASLKDDDGYLGLETYLLQREDKPVSISVESESVIVSYTPMERELSHLETEYYTLTNNLLFINKTPTEEDTIYKGYYVYGHESRTFTPCYSSDIYWISPESGSNAALKAIYEEKMREMEPYTPLYIVLSGHSAEGLSDGFGADFNESILINSILSIPDNGVCAENIDHISPQ